MKNKTRSFELMEQHFNVYIFQKIKIEKIKETVKQSNFGNQISPKTHQHLQNDPNTLEHNDTRP